MDPARLPLSDMKVLEVAGLFPGPFATMALADLGADVVKVERPAGGDPVRGLIPGFFESLNRNKRSVTVNLKRERGREVLKKLAGWADVVVEGFRPGVAARIGADYETLRGANPALIYCSITGYGQGGPYKDLPGHDLNYLGVAGAAETGGTPALLPAADTLAGVFAALSVVAACAGRENSGEGAYIDLSMTESVASAMAPLVNEYLARGRPDPAAFAVRPAYGVYRTRDGKHLSIACTETVFWERLCRLLGFDDYAGDGSLRSWAGRAARSVEIDARIRAEISTRKLGEWVDLFRDEDLPVAPVNGLDEVASDPQVSARGQVQGLSREGLPRALQFGFPALFGGHRPGVRIPPPDLGADTEEMLLGLGYSRDDLRSLRADGAV
jgi:crotonobetainyl-CoA:carnitine CoA-transferase CaiB-like acyl-CoA transferase